MIFFKKQNILHALPVLLKDFMKMSWNIALDPRKLYIISYLASFNILFRGFLDLTIATTVIKITKEQPTIKIIITCLQKTIWKYL